MRIGHINFQVHAYFVEKSCCPNSLSRVEPSAQPGDSADLAICDPSHSSYAFICQPEHAVPWVRFYTIKHPAVNTALCVTGVTIGVCVSWLFTLRLGIWKKSKA
jgi:hypothetical protein